jgi:hypothetical protein
MVVDESGSTTTVFGLSLAEKKTTRVPIIRRETNRKNCFVFLSSS